MIIERPTQTFTRPLRRVFCFILESMNTWQPRAGLYYWAGPGTIRMTKLKFFDPAIDERAFLEAYEPEALRALRDTLGLTDMWVTASWGFSDATEQEDAAWLRSKLPNFHRLGLKTHAYVQGPNIVSADFEEDLLCRGRDGNPIPYHRGRRLTCPLNPAARELLLRRVEAAAREDVDGVFVDNFFFGKFPLPTWGWTPFFGCACAHCRAAFWKETPPAWLHLDDPLTQSYIAFRTQTMAALAAELAAICRRHGKLYGCNGLDLDLDPRFFYGYDPKDLATTQSYLLTENFNHPSRGRSNGHLSPLITTTGVPLAVVSYVRSIGRHSALTQTDIDGVYTDATRHGYLPIYKGSEFFTHGRWHPLSPAEIRSPRTIPLAPLLPTSRAGTISSALRLVLSRYQTPIQTLMYESRLARQTLGRLIDDTTERASEMLTARHWLHPSSSA